MVFLFFFFFFFRFSLIFFFLKKETTIDSGYLYYLKTGESSIVPTIQNEVRGLIIQRNLLAYYLTQSKLPPLTTNSSICARCDFLDSCLIYHKV